MRPLPIHPRGPRRVRPRPKARPVHLLACPRVAPDYEIGTLRALMKPHVHTRDAIAHRSGLQTWPAGADDVIADALRVVRERLGFEPGAHHPRSGEYFVVIEVPDADAASGRALAVLLSRRLPGLWFVLGRLFVRDGRFYRRERGYKLNVVPATNVHLPRDVRAAISDALRDE